MTDQPACPICSEPYVLTRKFNGGDPKDVWLPECECEMVDVDAFLERLRARREVGQ